MRIAYMLTSLGRGGAEGQVVAIAERMAARGHQVVLIVLKPAEAHEWPTSVEIIRLDLRKSLASLWSGPKRARRHLREFRPDLVHSHTFPANMAARTLRIAGSTPAVLTTIHNIYEGGWWRTLAYGLTDGLSVHTTAVSDTVVKRHIDSGAVPKAKCSVITNGIDAAIFASSSLRRDEVRAELKVADNFVWLAAGRLTPAKDYPNLLRAFSLLLTEFPRARLWIAGEGSVVEEMRLRTIGDEFGISASVHWMGLRDDMPALLDAADGFVLSSAWEGMPLVVAEAMAMERPVVATDVGGVSELVGDTGVMIAPKHSRALADAMMSVMRLRENHRRQMGLAARERILQRFEINAKAEEWEALYTRILPE